MNNTNIVQDVSDETISYTIDTIVKGQFYEIRIENVFDPSKFWLIINFKELLLFTKYLSMFYGDRDNRKVIAKFKLKKNLPCIIYRNKCYYRAIVLPILLPEGNKIRVFMIDYGFIVNIDKGNIFYIFKKHCKVPRFAIRACLAYLSPPGNAENWSLSDLEYFCEKIVEKRLLMRISEINVDLKILFVEIFRVEGSNYESVNLLLLKSKVASYNKIMANKTESLTKYKKKIKYIHLFPSFDALEKGIVPCSLWEQNIVKDCVPLDLLYKSYYEYQEINAEMREDNLNYKSLTFMSTSIKKIASLLRKLNSKIAYQTNNNLRKFIRNSKEKISKIRKSGFYTPTCASCPQIYIGKTGRIFKNLLTELKKVSLNKKSDWSYASQILPENHNLIKTSFVEDILPVILLNCVIPFITCLCSM